jgi:hypothetical protein
VAKRSAVDIDNENPPFSRDRFEELLGKHFIQKLEEYSISIERLIMSVIVQCKVTAHVSSDRKVLNSFTNVLRRGPTCGFA